MRMKPSPPLTAAFGVATALRSRHAPRLCGGRSRRRRGAAPGQARGGSPRDRLDVAVLESEVLGPAGVSAEAIVGGALTYTRDPATLAAAVRSGEAILGFGVTPVTTDEVIAVADAGETMPQKTTYFYPKVPTGLVLFEV